MVKNQAIFKKELFSDTLLGHRSAENVPWKPKLAGREGCGKAGISHGSSSWQRSRAFHTDDCGGRVPCPAVWMDTGSHRREHGLHKPPGSRFGAVQPLPSTQSQRVLLTDLAQCTNPHCPKCGHWQVSCKYSVIHLLGWFIYRSDLVFLKLNKDCWKVSKDLVSAANKYMARLLSVCAPLRYAPTSHPAKLMVQWA